MGMNGRNALALVAGLVIAGSLSLMTMRANGLAEDEVGTRGMQRLVKPGVSGQSSASAQANAQVPTFPQKFEVQGPEVDTFGFAVTQPGPVVVDVQAQGAPLVVTLQSPGGQPITLPATGTVRMSYTVTPQDVQRSLFWQVQIRLAQPMPPQQGGKASGAVNVQYPPVNQTMVQQAVQAQAAQQKQPTPEELQQREAQAAAQIEQAFQQRKAQFDRQQLDRRAALHGQIQPQLDQLRSRMGGQVRPRGVEESEKPSAEAGASSEGEVGTRALEFQRIQKIMPLAPVAAPPPAIASLSVTQGQPGDPILINGAGFSNGGEVHFVVNPGKDLVAPVQVWTDTQIFATVPDIAGVLTYSGIVYVVRGSDQAKTNLVPWRFNPTLELREVRWTTDRQLKFPVEERAPTVRHGNGNPFWGFKDDDELFLSTRLKNAWLVDDVGVTCSLPWGNGMCDGNAYAIDSRRGTDSPYLKVHWWVPASFGGYKYTYYTYVVRVIGPKGVPDGIVVP
jgi:hypothetical protein